MQAAAQLVQPPTPSIFRSSLTLATPSACPAVQPVHLCNILRMYIEWLDVPPSFPGNVTRGSHPGFANHIAVKVFMNDLKVPACSRRAVQ